VSSEDQNSNFSEASTQVGGLEEGMMFDIEKEPETPEELRRIREEIPEEQLDGPENSQQSPREFVQEEMENPEAQGLGGSLTNELVETQAGTVLKEFSPKPKMAYFQMLGRIPSFTLEYQDQESRIENEETFRQYTRDMDVEVPEIIGVQDEYVEFEMLEGVDMIQRPMRPESL
jgi:hypothetical protein